MTSGASGNTTERKATPETQGREPGVTVAVSIPGRYRLKNGAFVRVLIQLELWVLAGEVRAAWTPYDEHGDCLHDALAAKAEADVGQFARDVVARWRQGNRVAPGAPVRWDAT